MRITRAQLVKIMPNAGSRADTYLPIINGWAEHFRINTPLRMAHYLAQIAQFQFHKGTIKTSSKSYGQKLCSISIP